MTSSSYVTIDQGTAAIRNLSAGAYTTLTDPDVHSVAGWANLLYNLTKAFKSP
jgi:hypothetical protein